MGAPVYPILFYGFIEEEENTAAWDRAGEREQGKDWEHWSNPRQEMGIVQEIAGLGYNEIRFLATIRYADDHLIVTDETIAVDPYWDQHLRDYVQAIGLDVGKQQPAWASGRLLGIDVVPTFQSVIWAITGGLLGDHRQITGGISQNAFI